MPLLILSRRALSALFRPPPARADFRVCNATQNLVGVAIGYRAKAGWITEGWWHIEGSSCKTLIEGPLSSRYYYLYAEDAERGGRWDGPINMCVAEKEFKIAGVNDCFARGFQRAGFQEYDTGEQASWMVQLTDRARNGRHSSRTPERTVNETQPQGQDPRHPRTGLLRRGDDQETVRSGRRCLPHQYEPYRPRDDAHAGRPHPRRRGGGRPADRHSGRPARAKLRVGKFANGKAVLTPGQTFTLDDNPEPGTPPGSTCRIPKS